MTNREEAHWEYDTDRKDERESTALDESSLEQMDSDSDLEDVFSWEVRILTVTMRVARRLLHKYEGEGERKILTEVTECIGIRVKMMPDSVGHQVEVAIRLGED